MKRLLVLLLIANLLQEGLAQKIVFTPQWIFQSQFAGYFIAQKLGFYQEAGLQVEITYPDYSSDAMGKLIRGESQFITSNLIEAMQQRSQGVPVVNVMQSSQQSGLVIVSHLPLNGKLSSLKGQKIGRWKAGHSELAVCALAKEGIAVNWIDFLSGINLFLSGAVDASVAMSYNEYPLILEAGRIVPDSCMLYFAQLGYNIPEEGVYVLASFLQENPEIVKQFVQASARGWQWAREHQDETINLVLEESKRLHIPVNRYHQQQMLEEILRLQIPLNAQQPSITLSEKHFEEALSLIFHGKSGESFNYKTFVAK